MKVWASVVLIVLFGLYIEAGQKPVSSFWREQNGDWVVLHFSPEFPALNGIDSFIMSFLINKHAKIPVVRVVPSADGGTDIAFLCADMDDLRIKEAIKVIKEAVREFVKIKEVRPPNNPHEPSKTPARLYVALVF